MPLAKAGVLGFKTFLQTPPAGREHEFIGLTMENEYQLYKGFAEVAKQGFLWEHIPNRLDWLRE